MNNPVQNYEDYMQISRGVAELAKIVDSMMQQYEAALKNADLNDPSFVAKFNETVIQPAIDNFKSTFTTDKSKTWAEVGAKALQNYFIKRSGVDISTLKGRFEA